MIYYYFFRKTDNVYLGRATHQDALNFSKTKRNIGIIQVKSEIDNGKHYPYQLQKGKNNRWEVC